MTSNVERYSTPVPAALWSDLHAESLLPDSTFLPRLTGPTTCQLITAVTTHDVRFPTSLTADGSDAMNKDGDYSAAYVVIHTDDPSLKGYGFTFTIGRGNDLCVEAARQRGLPLVGRSVAGIGRRPRSGLPRPERATPNCAGSVRRRASSTLLSRRS